MPAPLGIWAVVTLLGICARPVARAALAPLPGGGAGLERVLGLLLSAVPLWVLVSIGIVPYTTASAWAAVVAVAVVGGIAAWRGRGGERSSRLLVCGAEAMFTVTFLLGLLVVSHAPDVWGTERPLDMALVNTVDAARDFPPLDPWLSGHDLNYYYLGHYLMAFLIRLAGASPTAGYNVCVALVWALGASAAFGLGGAAAATMRRNRGTLLGALALTGLVVVGGNVMGAFDLAALEGPLRQFDWFGASRAIPGTVTDFPAFELVVGDLHAHVIAVPIMLAALAFGLHAALYGPQPHWRAALAALVAGALYPVNAWAAPAVFAVLLACGWRSWRWAGALLGGAVLIYLPFVLSTSTGGTDGIGRVPDREPLGAFLGDLVTVYGFALILIVVIVVRQLPRRALLVTAGAAVAVLPLAWIDDAGGPALVAVAGSAVVWLATQPDRPPLEVFALTLVAVGFGCLLVAEVWYLRDAFDSSQNFRFNTAYKLGFDAWVLLGAGAACLLAVHARSVRAWTPGLALIALCAISFPPAAAWTRTDGFAGPVHLDGLRWLERLAPGDPGAIAWLRVHADRSAVVLEAVGPEYSPQGHARMSVFSGHPTVIGWAGHELFYHPERALGMRTEDVRELYSTTDRRRARALLDRYAVRYVVVGPLERVTYPGRGTTKFARLGKRVYGRRGTAVFEIRSAG
jgi:YYY domain-containing protein